MPSTPGINGLLNGARINNRVGGSEGSEFLDVDRHQLEKISGHVPGGEKNRSLVGLKLTPKQGGGGGGPDTTRRKVPRGGLLKGGG